LLTGSLASVLVATLTLLPLVVGSVMAAQTPCGGFNALGFNFGGGFQGGFQGGFNNFGGGTFQGGFQGFQFGSGFGQFGGGNFQGGQFQGGSFNGGGNFQGSFGGGGGFQGVQFGGLQFQGGNFQGGFQGGINFGGFNFGGGGFQGGGSNFGGGGLNINSGVAPFAANFGGAAGCPGGVFGLIPDGATVAAGDKFQYRLVWVSPTNWQDLEYLDLRLRDTASHVVAQVRWQQGNDSYQLIDPQTGAVTAQGPSQTKGTLESPNLTVVLSDSYTDNSGPTGQAVGINATIIPKAPLAEKFLAVDVGSKNDGGAPTAFELAALLNITASENVSAGDDDKDDAKEHHKPTEEQRQQKERSNRSNLDDYRTEGNAVESSCEGDVPSVTIANRDGRVVIRLLHDAVASCGLVKPGDYVEAIGEKQHEQLYDADQLTVWRNGARVR